MDDKHKHNPDRPILFLFGSLVICLFAATIGFGYRTFKVAQGSVQVIEPTTDVENTPTVQISNTPIPTLVTPFPTKEPDYDKLRVGQNWPLVYFEDFETISDLWPIDEKIHPQFNYQRNVIDGEYLIEVRSDSERNFATIQTEFETGSSFYLSTEVKQISGSNNIPFGIIFHSSQNASEHIAFMINNKGEYYVYRKGYTRTLLPWLQSPYYTPGEFNRLTVISQISSIKLFLNDYMVANIGVYTRGGYAGFFIVYPGGTENAVFAFDNFEIRVP